MGTHTACIVPLDDKDHRCPVAILHSFDQLHQMPPPAGRDCIRKTGQAIQHQGNGFDLDEA
jgi:hypothetical protein